MKKNPIQEVGIFCDENTGAFDCFLPELRIGQSRAEMSGVHDILGATHAEIYGQIFVDQKVHAAARVTERIAPTRRA